MISREELKDVAKMQGNGSYYASLYLNVNPITNPKGEYSIWLKNAIKEVQEREKEAFKKIEKDLNGMESYIVGHKRNFRKGLVFISSMDNDFQMVFNLAVPVKSELIVDKSPYMKPLLDILDNYRRYAVFLADRESARIFLVHLGEITEFGELHTPDVPGQHKKGGWFALSQNHYERHIEHHVGLHLKDAVRKLERFLKKEKVERLIMGGSEDAIIKAREMLPRNVDEIVVGTISADMTYSATKVNERAEPVIQDYEKHLEEETITSVTESAMKSERAVVGLDGVLKALQEGRIQRLLFERDFRAAGRRCLSCNALWYRGKSECPYCGGEGEKVKYLIDLAAQRTVEQGGFVEIVAKGGRLQRAGSIGAFLRF